MLGLEVVLADGTVLNMLKKLKKDNTGYPLKHLFIGSEGTLGIITKVAIKLVPIPRSTNVILLKVNSFSELQQLLCLSRESLGEVLSAFEYMDSACLKCLQDNIPAVTQK